MDSHLGIILMGDGFTKNRLEPIPRVSGDMPAVLRNWFSQTFEGMIDDL